MGLDIADNRLMHFYKKLIYSRLVGRILLLCPLVFILSCSKKAEKANTSFALHMSALSAPLYDQGGAIVSGIEAVSGNRFALDVRAKDSIDLSPGKWTFYAIGWTGAAPLEGSARCEQLTMEIGNEATEVSMTLSAAKCSSAGFGQVLPLTVVSCDTSSLAAASSVASHCDASAGSALSYQIDILNYDTSTLVASEDATGVALASTSTLGACVDTSGVSVNPTPWTLPLLGAGENLRFKLVAFDSAGCTGNTLQTLASRSLASLTSTHASVFADATEIRLFVDDWVIPPAPIIAAVSPKGGLAGGGNVITISGSNFYNSTVTIGGANCTIGTVTSNSITCTTSASSQGIFDIVVTNQDSQSTTGTQLFEYGAIPTITTVTPNYGALAGGTSLTINGTGFSTHAGLPLIDIGGSLCQSVVVVNPTTINCTTALGTVGVQTITLTNANSLSGNLASGFTYQGAPTVSALSLDYGASVGGESITLTGTNFSNLGANPTVTINGVNCTSVVFASSTSISCTTGSSISGSYDVIVTNADGQSSVGQTIAYTYQDAPIVSSVSPFSGALAGGGTIVISGSNFSALGGSPTVLVDGNPCTSVVVVNPSTLSCTAPAGSAGQKTISVTNMDSQVGNLPNAYEYNDPLTVTSLSQNYAASSGGTTVSVFGTNFTNFMGMPSITIGGLACSSVTFTSSTTIDCVGTPVLAAGVYDVVITNPNGDQDTYVSSMTYQDAPVVSSLSIEYGSIAGGQALSIYGNNFSSLGGNPTVLIGGANCSGVTFASSTQIDCTTSTASPGGFVVTVTNMDGQASSGGPMYTYLSQPTVTGISPHAGLVNASTPVTITGTNFTNLGPGMSVVIGAMTCTGVSYVSPTELTCNTSASLTTGDYGVTVSGPDAQSGSLASAFTVGSFYLGSRVSNVALTSSNILAVLDSTYGLEIYSATDHQTVSARQAVVSGVGNVYDIEAVGATTFAVLGGSGSMLYLVDVTTPNAPSIMGSVSLGAIHYTMKVAGSIIYFGGTSGSFKVVDVSTLASPSIIHSSNIGSSTIGQIDISGTLLGMSGTNGFHLVDVTSPASPTVLSSSVPVSGITSITGFALIDVNNAVVAGNGSIKAIDITSPASPVVNWTGSLSFSSTAKVFVDGTTLIAIGNQAIGIFSVSNPVTPTSTYLLMATTLDVAINGALMVAAMDGGGARFFSGNLNPSAVNLHGNLGGTPSLSVVDETNDKLYVAAGKQLNIIDITNPFSPTLLGSYIDPDTTHITGLQLHGGYLYYTNNNSTNALKILDISTPSSPTVVGTPPSFATSVSTLRISGNVMTVTLGTGSLEVYEITDINTINLASTVASAGGIAQVNSPTSSRTFLGSGTNIREVDFSTPASATLINNHATSLTSPGLAIDTTESAMVAFKAGGLPEFYDITSSVNFMSTGPDSGVTSALFGLNTHQDTLFAVVSGTQLYCYDTTSLVSIGTLSSTALTGVTHTVLGHDGEDALYLGNSDSRLRVVSVRDSSSPYAP